MTVGVRVCQCTCVCVCQCGKAPSGGPGGRAPGGGQWGEPPKADEVFVLKTLIFNASATVLHQMM